MVKINGYDYQISNKPNKKLKVVVNNKTIHFGDSRYEHYFDKTGLLDKKLNHNDDIRRANYLKRAKGIKDKNGELTYLNPESATYHAVRILW